MAPSVDINYAAVLVAAVVAYLIGFLWYSVLFGKAWMKLSNISEKQIKKSKEKGMAKNYAIEFLSTLLMAYILAHFVDYTQGSTIMEGLQAGFWIWLGFVATIMLGSVLCERKPWKLYMVNAV